MRKATHKRNETVRTLTGTVRTPAGMLTGTVRTQADMLTETRHRAFPTLHHSGYLLEKISNRNVDMPKKATKASKRHQTSWPLCALRHPVHFMPVRWASCILCPHGRPRQLARRRECRQPSSAMAALQRSMLMLKPKCFEDNKCLNVSRITATMHVQHVKNTKIGKVVELILPYPKLL